MTWIGYDRRSMRQVVEDALEKAGTDPEFSWPERMPSEFYNPDFTKELARYIRNSLENAGLQNRPLPPGVKHVYTQDFLYVPCKQPLTNYIEGQWVSVEVIDGKVYRHPVINGEVDYSKPIEEQAGC